MTEHKDDWFRKPRLTQQEIERFEQKLKRTRSSRHEYMRIQAYSLENAGQFSRTLELIDRIQTEEPDHYSLTLLYALKANCFRKMGNIDSAIHWYRASLQREKDRPSVIGTTSTEFPFWVATERLEQLYDEAHAILLETIDPRHLFPMTSFKQYAALALITAEMGYIEDAKSSARAALLYAERTKSNAANHRNLGLVGNAHGDLKRKLRRIVAGLPPHDGKISLLQKVLNLLTFN